MEKNLKIEKYKVLLGRMHNLCEQMPKVIFNRYFDDNKYLYSLYFDAFTSIKGFCVLLGNGALIPQASMVLRMALEQTATLRVLEMHKELMGNYIDHQKYRIELIISDKNKDEKKGLIKEHFANIIESKDKPYDFLEYGWFKALDKNYSFDSLIKLAEIQKENDSLNKWKNQLNQWTHGAIKYINLLYDDNLVTQYAHELTLIAAKLLDVIVCEFHNETKFDFKINGIDYQNDFINAYKAVL